MHKDVSLEASSQVEQSGTTRSTCTSSPVVGQLEQHMASEVLDLKEKLKDEEGRSAKLQESVTHRSSFAHSFNAVFGSSACPVCDTG